MADYATINLHIEGPLARLTLNRPEQRNGMTNRMVRETHEALTRVAADAEVRLLLLTGAGRSFCPGADLNRISSGERDAEDWCGPEHFQVPALLHGMPQLTVAAVNGACAGAGFGWACGCDLRVAARSAMLNTAFLNVAVAGDMGLPWSLPRLVGARQGAGAFVLLREVQRRGGAKVRTGGAGLRRRGVSRAGGGAADRLAGALTHRPGHHEGTLLGGGIYVLRELYEPGDPAPPGNRLRRPRKGSIPRLHREAQAQVRLRRRKRCAPLGLAPVNALHTMRPRH